MTRVLKHGTPGSGSWVGAAARPHGGAGLRRGSSRVHARRGGMPRAPELAPAPAGEHRHGAMASPGKCHVAEGAGEIPPGAERPEGYFGNEAVAQGSRTSRLIGLCKTPVLTIPEEARALSGCICVRARTGSPGIRLMPGARPAVCGPAARPDPRSRSSPRHNIRGGGEGGCPHESRARSCSPGGYHSNARGREPARAAGAVAARLSSCY